jgi:hypothetical protein
MSDENEMLPFIIEGRDVRDLVAKLKRRRTLFVDPDVREAIEMIEVLCELNRKSVGTLVQALAKMMALENELEDYRENDDEWARQVFDSVDVDDGGSGLLN